MKYFIAGSEKDIEIIINTYKNLILYNLYSFYYLQQIKYELNDLFNSNKEILIDSGAYTFLFGGNTNYQKYFESYYNFINKYKNNPNIIGFFELDIEEIVGIETVNKWREKLESTGAKIIPVWHKHRGIEEYKKLCEKYNYIAIVINREEDLYYKDVPYFLNYALMNNTKIHGLGTNVPFKKTKTNFYYSIDSTRYIRNAINNALIKKPRLINIKNKEVLNKVKIISYGIEMLKQIYYLTGNNEGLKYLKKKYPDLTV